MKTHHARPLLALILGLGFGLNGNAIDADGAEPPLLQPPVAGPDPGPPDSSTATRKHEALPANPATSPSIHVDKAPPAPVIDRPGVDAPEANAHWIEGYWDWDPDRKEFVWMTGTWLVPPPGRFWVNGFWRREEQGWSRSPGFWSDRKADVRRDGPPTVSIEDQPGPAPGPDYFYVPGQYVPAGDGVAWKPGFWAKAQAGWEWVPARWVRQSDGWTYREGHWEKAAAPIASRGAAPARNVPPSTGSTSPFNPTAPTDSRPLDPIESNELAAIPDAGRPATPGPPDGTVAGPHPDPNLDARPSVVRPILPAPLFVNPYLPPNLPITDIDLPGRLHIQVVPGRIPRIGRSLVPYRGILPRVSVGVRDPFRGP